MQPQDVYNRAFDATTAAMDRWIETIKDVAHVEREQTNNYWRLRVRPFEPNSCAAELMLSRSQTFDLEIATEGLSSQPVTDLSLFQPLLQAIAEGRAVKRNWSASATGVELMREIIVRLTDGREWTMRRMVSAGTAATETSALANDRVFVAYRRD